MKRGLRIIGLLAILSAATAEWPAARAHTTELRPGVVLNQPGRRDGSFNQAIADGVERFRRDTGIAVAEVEAGPGLADEAIHALIGQGINLVLSGFHGSHDIATLARDHPDVRFVVIDSTLALPNVQAITFREHEGAFLVGILAAMFSKTGKTGFIGGMDVPVIRRIGCGYAQGIRHARPEAEPLWSVTGTTMAAFNNPAAGRRQAEDQLARGADVIFAAAGRTGRGALEAIAEAGRLAIGMDLNQNDLYPGVVLTSLTKRVDIAAYRALKKALGGTWRAGVESLGLAENGIGWSLDQHNAPLISDDVFNTLERSHQDIVGGTLTVHDYTDDDRCDAWPDGRPPWPAPP